MDRKHWMCFQSENRGFKFAIYLDPLSNWSFKQCTDGKTFECLNFTLRPFDQVVPVQVGIFASRCLEDNGTR